MGQGFRVESVLRDLATECVRYKHETRLTTYVHGPEISFVWHKHTNVQAIFTSFRPNNVAPLIQSLNRSAQRFRSSAQCEGKLLRSSYVEIPYNTGCSYPASRPYVPPRAAENNESPLFQT